VGGYFRIGFSIVIGVVLIGGALFVREQLAVAGTETPNDISKLLANKILREYQDVKDTDGDGLKDWEEQLRGSSPALAEASLGTSTPGEKRTFEANTLTEKFSVDFFDAFMRAHTAGAKLTDEDQQKLVETSARRFASENKTTLYTRADISIVENSTDEAIRTYANAIGSVVAKNSPDTPLENEAVILKKAVEADKPEMLEDLATIRDSYVRIVDGMLKIPVPTELATEHLNLVNAFAAIRDDVAGMHSVFEDPMLSYIRLKRYPDDADGMVYAIEGIRAILEKKELIFDSSDMGSFFYALRP
jgi:hypothetical protein